MNVNTLVEFESIFLWLSLLIYNYLKLKYPIKGLSNSPINIALSSTMFDSSQQVSGNNAQLWHAARLQELGPCPWLSMQIGSLEHHLAFSIAL